MEYIFQRGKWFYYRRRVPRFIRPFYEKDIIQVSLKTDSQKLAMQRATLFNNELERIWADCVKDNGSHNSDNQIARAKQISRLHGFSYLSADDIAKGNINDIIGRLGAVESHIDQNPEIVEAVLGKHKTSSMKISEAINHYFEFQKVNLLNKSANQIRKWKNPRIKAVNNFIDINGDLSASEINRDHILSLREWWFERIQSEGLSTGSPNKDFTHLRSLFSFIRDDQKIDLNIEHLFSRVRFTNVGNSRPPFPTDFIQDTLLNMDNLEGLHKECQYFLFAMADTGARPSELLGLDAGRGDIQLGAPIPYIYIRPSEKKSLKTNHSERQIPLVGSSLYAFKHLPKGFVHYNNKPDQLSANINKFLREHNLVPSGNHSVYSLRHSFEDRLTSVEPPEKVQAALMGHRYGRPRYGDGPTLEQKKRWLDRICFKHL